jgi:Outer membrane protein beta-barrel domain
MKKVVLVLAIIAVGFGAQAQVKFGVKAGLNGYNFSGDDTDGENFKTKIGFNAGGFANIPVGEKFSVQPELIYSVEGAKISEGEDRVNYNMNYINIPVLVQFNSASGFYAEAGPQIGFLTSAKADTKIGGVSTDTDVKEFFKGTNFSAAIGLGYKLSSGLGFGARYNFGLGNIGEEAGSDIKLGGFQVGLSFSFGGGKKETKD